MRNILALHFVESEIECRDVPSARFRISLIDKRLMAN